MNVYLIHLSLNQCVLCQSCDKLLYKKTIIVTVMSGVQYVLYIPYIRHEYKKTTYRKLFRQYC